MFLFNLLLVLSISTSAVFSAAIQTSNKARRGGTSGLFPFPRVGRAMPGKSWMLSPEDMAELRWPSKRQGLIPFPRVGRSGADANGDPSGMWFGPRLGRVSKRTAPFDDEAPWTMIALREVSPPRDFTPRLGRESEEQQQDDDQMDQEQPEPGTLRQKRQVL